MYDIINKMSKEIYQRVYKMYGYLKKFLKTGKPKVLKLVSGYTWGKGAD